MEVINLKKEFKGEAHGYTIKHNQPIGWQGTTCEYLGWYRYKRDAVKRMKELLPFIIW